MSANTPPWLFLSHSGADTEAARELKRRLLASPDAAAAGLRIWLDKDDLIEGFGWQAQLEKAILEDATAFAIHVGANGVENWVERELRLALSRAATSPDFAIIPILAKEAPKRSGSAHAFLPPFARQYHAVSDPLGDPDAFAKLLRAVLSPSASATPIVLDQPFVGLRAMAEADADRFFGRDEELQSLVGLLKQQSLVASSPTAAPANRRWSWRASFRWSAAVPWKQAAAASPTTGSGTWCRCAHGATRSKA